MNVLNILELDQSIVLQFFKDHWGSLEMVLSTGVYQCHLLKGFAIIEDGCFVGLITYTLSNEELEIISLDSVLENKGIGTKLLQTIVDEALLHKCKTIKVITTNDNLHALKFYQKRGFVLSRLLVNAVEKAREIKPEIPLVGNEGIPIRDEIELRKVLS